MSFLYFLFDVLESYMKALSGKISKLPAKLLALATFKNNQEP
jgi:hypothetical protein